MRQLNKTMSIPYVQRISQSYQKEQMKMEMVGDMMESAMEDVEDSDVDAEEEVLNQIYDEIGLETTKKLESVTTPSKLPKKVVSTKVVNKKSDVRDVGDSK